MRLLDEAELVARQGVGEALRGLLSAQPLMLAMLPSRIVVPLAVGALLGLLAWSFGGPTVVSWWYEPPVKDALSCAPSVRQAVSDFVRWGLGVAAISALISLTLVSLVRRRFGGGPPAPLEKAEPAERG